LLLPFLLFLAPLLFFFLFLAGLLLFPPALAFEVAFEFALAREPASPSPSPPAVLAALFLVFFLFFFLFLLFDGGRGLAVLVPGLGVLRLRSGDLDFPFLPPFLLLGFLLLTSVKESLSLEGLPPIPFPIPSNPLRAVVASLTCLPSSDILKWLLLSLLSGSKRITFALLCFIVFFDIWFWFFEPEPFDV